MGSSTCSVCSRGQFSTGPAASTCLSCTSGTYTESRGATTAESCVNCSKLQGECSELCLPGEYIDVVSGLCKDCPIGLILNKTGSVCMNCPQGEKYINSTLCSHTCPSGMREVVIQSKFCAGCIICELCPAGTFSIANSSNTQCLFCGKQTYSEAGSSTCHSCTPGQGLCALCDPGFYPVKDKAMNFKECSKCEAGKYMPIYAGETCIQCDVAGTFSLAGSTACSVCNTLCKSATFFKEEECNTTHDIVCIEFQTDIPYHVKVAMTAIPLIIGVISPVLQIMGTAFSELLKFNTVAPEPIDHNFQCDMLQQQQQQQPASVTVSSTLFGTRYLGMPWSELPCTNSGLQSTEGIVWDDEATGTTLSNVSEPEKKAMSNAGGKYHSDASVSEAQVCSSTISHDLETVIRDSKPMFFSGQRDDQVLIPETLPAVTISNDLDPNDKKMLSYSGQSARLSANLHNTDSQVSGFGTKQKQYDFRAKLQLSLIVMDMISRACLLSLVHQNAPNAIYYTQLIALIWPAFSDAFIFFESFFDGGIPSITGLNVYQWVSSFVRRLLFPDENNSDMKSILSKLSKLFGEYVLSFTVQGQLLYFQLNAQESSFVDKVMQYKLKYFAVDYFISIFW
jgi:hypothetical protein